MFQIVAVEEQPDHDFRHLEVFEKWQNLWTNRPKRWRWVLLTLHVVGGIFWHRELLGTRGAIHCDSSPGDRYEHDFDGRHGEAGHIGGRPASSSGPKA